MSNITCSVINIEVAGPTLIEGTEYTNCNESLTTPLPLNMVITSEQNIITFSYVPDPSDPFNSVTLGTLNYSNAVGITGVAGVSFPSVGSPTIPVFIPAVGLRLNGPISGIDNNLYKSGDTYVPVRTGGVDNPIYALYFVRTKSFGFEASGNQNISCNTPCFRMNSCTNNICDNIRVPRINITAQTNVSGSDLGDALFEIFDEYLYYDHKPLKDTICRVNYIHPNKLKTTVFEECCLYIASVLKGKGNTAHAKVLYLYNHIKLDITFEQFYQNILLYACGKLILSRILYGNFNVKYLLGKYNEQFLKDLGESRFCAFIEFFESCDSPVRGYNKYFKDK